LLASVIGRFPRFFLEVWLIHRFGPEFLQAMRKPKWRITFAIAIAATIAYFIW